MNNKLYHRVKNPQIYGGDWEEGGSSSSSVVAEFIRLPSPERSHYVYSAKVDVQPNPGIGQYVYFKFPFDSQVKQPPLFRDVLRQVDALAPDDPDHQLHFSFFARSNGTIDGCAGSVKIESDGYREESYWLLDVGWPGGLDDGLWHNVVLDTAAVQTKSNRFEVNLSRVTQFTLSVAPPGATGTCTGTLELALMSLTSDPTPLPAAATLPKLYPEGIPDIRQVWGPQYNDTLINENPFPDITEYALYRDSGAITESIAVLVTDTGARWLGVAHALKQWGLPFFFTTDADYALDHHFVLVFPYL